MITLIGAGLLNVFLIPFGFYRCWDLGGRFSFKEVPLSYATKIHTKHVFTFYIISIAVSQTLFLLEIFKVITYIPTHLLLIPVSSMLALLLSGAIHSTTSKLIHRTAIAYMVVSLIFWSVLWHMFLYSINPIVGTLGFIISATVLIGCPGLHLYYKNFGMSEILFAAATVTWNILMISFVLHNLPT